MSGIAGVVRLDGGAVTAEQLQAMLASMRRRGPDRRELACFGEAGFAQALLATTPEALAEVQPWQHPHSGCVVVSDSRLDNRPELLRELDILRPADEVGDGELLHAAWQRWGSDCADRLLGDFAFAIWNPSQQSLFCARDIMGVRPFYFHHAPGRLFAFASDAEALLTLADVPCRPNEGRVGDALLQEPEGIDRTSTFYLDIERLPPARILQVDRTQLIQTEYWQPLQPRPEDLPDSAEAWANALRSALEQAVRSRLRGHGAVGCMISGGLDSSSAAALGQQLLEREHGGRLPTFSAINSQGPCAETDAVRAMLDAFDFNATCVDLHALQAVTPAVQAQLDQLREPFDASMTLISAVYAAAAQAGVRSVMDGVPADNLYTAGGHFRGLALAGHWRALWREAHALHRNDRCRLPLLRTGQTVLGAVLPPTLRRRREARQAQAQYQQLCRDARIAPEFAQRIGLRQRFDTYRENMARTRLGNPTGTPHSIMTVAYITAGVERYNRVASFHGIEPRHPFLDRRMIELHAWLPLGLRLREGRYKWILRKAVEGLLPHDVTWRRGKEHIGYLFNQALLGPRVQALKGQPGLPDGMLRPLPNQAGVDEADGASMAATLLGAWWQRQFSAPVKTP